jgi:hypothetical protein
MLSKLRDRLGAAGLVVAIVALIAALAGTAFAAAGLNGKQKQEVTKIAKNYAGKPGANGATGANGANGAKGDKGDTGPQGLAGKDGGAGVNGKNVALTPITLGGLEGHCAGQGGTRVEVEGVVASRQFICNGESGFTETLPSGKTETGMWSGVALSEESGATTIAGGASISFNIPLANAPTLKIVPEAGEAPDCPGSFSNPEAAGGKLCLYKGPHIGEEPAFQTDNATKVGAFVIGICAEFCRWQGTWAVTAE